MKVILLKLILQEVEEMRRELDENLMRRLQLRFLRDVTNPFDLSENHFRRSFGMPQEIAVDLIEELKPFDTRVYAEIPFYLQVLIALNFYARRSFQLEVGLNNAYNVSQASVSRCIGHVFNLIESHLSQQYIKFSTTQQGKQAIAQKFADQFRLPGVIGAIDCSQMHIKSPPQDNPIRPSRLYRNRKMFFSINVEAIVDSEMIFLRVNPKFLGSVHDNAIWKESEVRRHLIESIEEPYFLLADRGYPLEPFIFPPIPNATQPAGIRFNKRHKKARNCVERSFGSLKGRFICLSKYRTLMYYPTEAARIIHCCCTLYNFLRMRRIVFEDDEVEEVEGDTHQQIPESEFYNIALQKRNNYMNT